MGQAAIGTAGRNEQDDRFPVLSLRSRVLQLSMAVSLSAHVVLAVVLISETKPASMTAFGDVNAMEVAFIDLAPAASDSRADPRPVPSVPSRPATLSRIAPTSGQLVLKPESAPAAEARAERRAALVKPAVDEATQEERASSSEAVSQAGSSHDGPTHGPQAHGSPSALVTKAGEKKDTDNTFITEPRFRMKPAPAVYPKRARELGQQGEALIHARLDPDGDPEEVLVWRSSGFALLDNAALAAVRRWQFVPARRNGHPTVAWVEIPVRFQLNGF